MEPQVGKVYSRREIRDLVGGGSTQSYLPSINGRIVCGCFDPALNTRAPFEIDLGAGPIVESSAESFVRQGHAVPVFLKRQVRSWQFVGDFRATGISRNNEDMRTPNRRPDTVAVLFLEDALQYQDKIGLVSEFDVASTSTVEGREHLRIHLAKERSRALVQAKKRVHIHEHGELSCEACGLRAGSLPIDWSDACFEVHHIQPLSECNGVRSTSLDDLAIVCANCHRMLHRSTPILAVHELRALLTLPHLSNAV